MRLLALSTIESSCSCPT